MTAKPEIVIIDYRLGNLFSIKQAIELFGYKTLVTSDLDDVGQANAIVLPGVGAFGKAMSAIEDLGLNEVLKSKVSGGVPLFGVCLGMQLLFETSEEFGLHRGLGLIKGSIKKLNAVDVSGEPLRIPHMGWSKLLPVELNRWVDSPLGGITFESEYYFVHSFHCVPENPDEILAECAFGHSRFCAAMKHRNIFATQFHPEKSGKTGLRIVGNWLESLS